MTAAIVDTGPLVAFFDRAEQRHRWVAERLGRPNGWRQWVAVKGLTSFGCNLFAEKVACRWMVNISRVYRQTGKLLEKYDVIAADRAGGGGEYPTQDGFGWTNGVTLKLMALYPADADLASVDLCPGGRGG